MRIRVLGAHNMETAQTKHTCFLVDDSLAIDAGSLMTCPDLPTKRITCGPSS